MVRAIKDNNDPTAGKVSFTPSRATEMLPLVRSIAADMIKLSEAIAAQREQIKVIDGLPQTIEHVHYEEELRDIRASLAADELRLRQCMDELAALGIESHHPIDGSIDFPAVINRREVRLCWHPGEDEVAHWHEPGVADHRQQVERGMFDQGSLN